MKIKIKSKKYQGNIRNKTNTVYFEINGIPKEVQIINCYNYEEGSTINKFVVSETNNKLWEYIKSCGYDLKIVQDRILYEIWKYSHGKRGEFKMKYNCIKCGSNNLFVEIQGQRKGLYCGECGKWQKWITKEELQIAKFNKITVIEKR